MIMKSLTNTATKLLNSNKIVGQFTISNNPNTYVMLRYCLQVCDPKAIANSFAACVTYFSGFPQVAQNAYGGPFQAAETPPHTPQTNDQPQEIIAIYPRWLLIRRTNNSQTALNLYRRDSTGQLVEAPLQHSDATFSTVLQSMHDADHPEADLASPSDPAFRGGLLGFIGYDLGAAQHIHTQRTPNLMDEQLDAAIGDYDIFFKREKDGWTLYGPDDPVLYPLYSHIRSIIEQPAQKTWTPVPTSSFALQTPFRPRWSQHEYAEAFRRIQDYLHAGDCYQVNLTQPFHARCQGDLLSCLSDLADLTRAPYLAYMHVLGHELLSCSPELFVAFTGPHQDAHGMATNTVITRPIKGTYPRGSTPEEDASTRLQLQQSEKDQSENLMIVDLLRNDLGRHATVGSVQVPKLFEIESFAQVHHLVSEIRADLVPGVSPLAVLLDALPGGSITGAPKKRAMEIINELEYGPRGAYCGSFGYLNADGSGQFNILIRTLQKYRDDLVIWAGGGITVASEVNAEYAECLHKIGAILAYFNRLHHAV